MERHERFPELKGLVTNGRFTAICPKPGCGGAIDYNVFEAHKGLELVPCMKCGSFYVAMYEGKIFSDGGEEIKTDTPTVFDTVTLVGATTLPVIWLDRIVYPKLFSGFHINEDGTPYKRLAEVFREKKTGTPLYAIALLRRDGSNENQLLADDLAGVGTLVEVHDSVAGPAALNVSLRGIARVIPSFQDAEFKRAISMPFSEQPIEADTLKEAWSIFRLIRERVVALVELKGLSQDLQKFLYAVPEYSCFDVSYVLDPLFFELGFPHFGLKQQEFLEAFADPDHLSRLKKAHYVLASAQIRANAEAEADQENEKNREIFVLQQVREMTEKKLCELTGDSEDSDAENNKLRVKIEAVGMPEDVKKEALRQCERLKKMSSMHPEQPMIEPWLADWMIRLPWKNETATVITEKNRCFVLAEAEKILNKDHYGIRNVKERILEFLSVRALNPTSKGPILCFYGPPGVGKTSLGQSIARALGREFVRISLGGIRDEAEIRGHRRTYIGALPGRIIQGMREAGSQDPVFMIDEVDKIASDFRGDPSSALLEALDPEQNGAFSDNYLGVPFDLSKVFFIVTANSLDPIQSALRNRLEAIEISGYSENEKIQIAKGFLIPQELREHGLIRGETPLVVLHNDALYRIIGEYTREAGVRDTKRSIARVYRKAARNVVLHAPNKESGVIKIGYDDIPSYLGPPKFPKEMMKSEDRVGVATMLYASESGGGTMLVECLFMKGSGNITLTGKLGKTLEESARVAISFARAHADSLGIDEALFQKKDVHIHAPIAVEKDGPSAGVPLGATVISRYSGRPIRHNFAATGEISLGGDILPVGGLKAKFLGALRDGMSTVLYPLRNKFDVDDILADPENADLKQLHLIPVKHLSEALAILLLPEEKKRKSAKTIRRAEVRGR